MNVPQVGYDVTKRCVMPRLQPTEEWIDTEAAAKLTNVSTSQLRHESVLSAVRHMSRSIKGQSAVKRVGRLWYRPDLLRLIKIRRECRCRTVHAALVMLALNEGRI